MKKIGLVVGAIVVILLGFGGKWAHDNFTVELPKYPPTSNVVWLNQNWTAEQREWFHHADQGTQTFGIPYEWFIALEQPALSFTAPGLLSDPVYLDRYGFIPSNTNPAKPQLPVGFAHGGPWQNPQTKAERTALGFELKDAVLEHPQDLVGYNLRDPDGYLHAMVLDLRTCTPGCISWMVFSDLPVARYQYTKFSSEFVGWLPGHRKAIIEIGDKDFVWLDQYIVDFEAGRVFSPTLKANPSWKNNGGLMPYRISKRQGNDAEGYLFSEIHPGEGPENHAVLYRTPLDGDGKKDVNPLNGTEYVDTNGNSHPVPVNIHGCALSDDSKYMVCERSCDKHVQNMIPGPYVPKGEQDRYGVKGPSCFQFFEVDNVYPFVRGRHIRLVGPVAVGSLWSPTSSGFVYYGGTDDQELSINFMLPNRDSEGFGYDVNSKTRYHHSNKILANPKPPLPALNPAKCDSELNYSGSDAGLGRWDARAFYFSVVRNTGDLKYNQVGRVVLHSLRTKDDLFAFEELTPGGKVSTENWDARLPSPGPDGSSSLVFLATKYDDRVDSCVSPGEQWPADGPVQIFLSRSRDRKHPRRLTHFQKGWTPTDTQWHEVTSVVVNTKDIPSQGVGTGTFTPAIYKVR
jgi:hypothetical protein